MFDRDFVRDNVIIFLSLLDDLLAVREGYLAFFLKEQVVDFLLQLEHLVFGRVVKVEELRLLLT